MSGSPTNTIELPIEDAPQSGEGADTSTPAGTRGDAMGDPSPGSAPQKGEQKSQQEAKSETADKTNTAAMIGATDLPIDSAPAGDASDADNNATAEEKGLDLPDEGLTDEQLRAAFAGTAPAEETTQQDETPDDKAKQDASKEKATDPATTAADDIIAMAMGTTKADASDQLAATLKEDLGDKGSKVVARLIETINGLEKQIAALTKAPAAPTAKGVAPAKASDKAAAPSGKDTVKNAALDQVAIMLDGLGSESLGTTGKAFTPEQAELRSRVTRKALELAVIAKNSGKRFTDTELVAEAHRRVIKAAGTVTKQETDRAAQRSQQRSPASAKAGAGSTKKTGEFDPTKYASGPDAIRAAIAGK